MKLWNFWTRKSSRKRMDGSNQGLSPLGEYSFRPRISYTAPMRTRFRIAFAILALAAVGGWVREVCNPGEPEPAFQGTPSSVRMARCCSTRCGAAVDRNVRPHAFPTTRDRGHIGLYRATR